MKNLRLLAVLMSGILFSPLSLSQETPKQTSDGRPAFIVSPAWVAEHIASPSLVLLQVGDRKEYDSIHIPGAQFIALSEISIPYVEGQLVLEIPALARLDSVFEAKGVSDSSRVVVYPGKDWFSPSARVYLTLDYLGFGKRTFFMDGGMPAWMAGGRAVTSTVTTPSRGNFTPHPREDVIVKMAWVREHLTDPKVALLDARNPQFYTGKDTGNASRPGHIPGARNLPFDTMVDSSGKFKSRDELMRLFRLSGMDAEKTAVSYCHVGQQASLLYFVARYLGYDARMYDGSMQEWTRDPDMPVVVETKSDQ